MSTVTPDCLVLKIEEIEETTGLFDNTMYVIYDTKRDVFLIRGQRRRSEKMHCCSYSFECDSVSHLADFIEYCVCPDNRVNEVLYNYDNLPENAHDITFDFLCDYDHADYELSGYNNQWLNRHKLLRNLRMLRNVFNCY